MLMCGLKAVVNSLFVIFALSTATPYPGGFKCFTCEEASDNYECNRWAPDLYCPKESKYCYTSHKLDWSGNTLSVTKSCAALEDCVATGCSELDHEGNKVSGTDKLRPENTDNINNTSNTCCLSILIVTECSPLFMPVMLIYNISISSVKL
uniref:LY6/PLAUR domain containing 6 n=1 Tax=Astyanax mexicanus TaxID=7994 RepID=A0A8B9GX94_ASTMX